MKYRKYTEEELKWINSFKRVMKKAPSTLFLFVGAGVTVFPKDEHNDRYMTEFGGVDGEADGIDISTKMDCDGGDY